MEIDSRELSSHLIHGVRCVVRDSGPPEEEAIVFVHGNPGPMDDWNALFERMRGVGRVIAMDLPGFGRAARSARFAYSLQAYSTYLERLLDRLGVSRAHLVLHDMGGLWGLTWAASHPLNVASVTLINTGVLRDYEWHTFARIWQTPVLGELLQWTAPDWMIRREMIRKNPRPLPPHFVKRVLGFSDRAQRKAVLRIYRELNPPEPIFRKLEAALETLRVPVCVLWGAEDAYIPVSYAHDQVRVFEGAELHVLPGLGHWPFIDDAVAVGDKLEPFLRSSFRSEV